METVGWAEPAHINGWCICYTVKLWKSYLHILQYLWARGQKTVSGTTLSNLKVVPKTEKKKRNFVWQPLTHAHQNQTSLSQGQSNQKGRENESESESERVRDRERECVCVWERELWIAYIPLIRSNFTTLDFLAFQHKGATCSN
jgi:hypothetical protein